MGFKSRLEIIGTIVKGAQIGHRGQFDWATTAHSGKVWGRVMWEVSKIYQSGLSLQIPVLNLQVLIKFKVVAETFKLSA